MPAPFFNTPMAPGKGGGLNGNNKDREGVTEKGKNRSGKRQL